MTQPRVYVDAPVVAPYGGGLFSVAQPVPGLDPANPHWMLGGVEWDSVAAVPVQHYLAGLFAGHGSAVTKTLPAQPAITSAWPTAIFGGIDCGTFGRPVPEYEERARRIVELNAQHAVEETLWSGTGLDPAAVTNGGLNGTAKATDITPGASTSLLNGLGLLETWLANNYSGRGILHASRLVAPYAAYSQYLRDNPDDPLGPPDMTSPLGTRWAFGGGYNGSGPGNTTPAAGTTWIYATGQIVIVKSDVQVPATFQASINRTLNREFLLAEQLYLVGIDGPWAACHVTLP